MAGEMSGYASSMAPNAPGGYSKLNSASKNQDDLREIKKRMEHERKIRRETLRRRKMQRRKQMELQQMEDNERNRKLRERRLKKMEQSSNIKVGKGSDNNDRTRDPPMLRSDETQSHVIARPCQSVSGRTIYSEQFDTMSFADSAAQFRQEAMKIRDLCEQLHQKDLHELEVSPKHRFAVPDCSRVSNLSNQSPAKTGDMGNLPTEIEPYDSLESESEDDPATSVSRVAKPREETQNEANKPYTVNVRQVPVQSIERLETGPIRQTIAATGPIRMIPVTQAKTTTFLPKRNVQKAQQHDPVPKVRAKPKPRWGGGKETEQQRQRRLAYERRMKYAKMLPVPQANAQTPNAEDVNLKSVFNSRPKQYVPISNNHKTLPSREPMSSIQMNTKPHYGDNNRQIPHNANEKTSLNYTLEEMQLKESLERINLELAKKKTQQQHVKPRRKQVNMHVNQDFTGSRENSNNHIAQHMKVNQDFTGSRENVNNHKVQHMSLNCAENVNSQLNGNRPITPEPLRATAPFSQDYPGCRPMNPARTVRSIQPTASVEEFSSENVHAQPSVSYTTVTHTPGGFPAKPPLGNRNRTIGTGKTNCGTGGTIQIHNKSMLF